MVIAAMKLKDAPWQESYDQPRQHIEKQRLQYCKVISLQLIKINGKKKQRHYFVNQGPSGQGYFSFPVVMFGYESWTIKKAEHQRIDALELWCGRRLLRACWIARRSNQSILKEISLEYSLEGLMLRLNSNTLVT